MHFLGSAFHTPVLVGNCRERTGLQIEAPYVNGLVEELRQLSWILEKIHPSSENPDLHSISVRTSNVAASSESRICPDEF